MDELNFTTDSIKLLNSFPFTVRIFQDSQIIHSNTVSADDADPGLYSITDKSYILWDEESFDYIKINRSSIRVDVKRKSNCEHMILRINLDGNSCYLVFSNSDCRESFFKEYIQHVNAGKDFENIIIVEDDSVVIQTYKYIFDFLGYNTVLFSNPVHALDYMKSADFDLLVSDYNMPDLNGFDLVKSLIGIKPMIPVIICSGLMDMYSDLFQYFGNDHHISLMNKPVTITKLSNRLEVIEFITRLCSFCREKIKP